MWTLKASRGSPAFSFRSSIVGKKLYVGNLPFGTTGDDLTEVFSQYGTVQSAQVVMDRDTGRSRGFAFVEMADGADQAIAAMSGAEFQGRTLTVNRIVIPVNWLR